MATAEASEFPDLDTLINAAEDRSGTGESSGEGSSDKGAFDPDEYANVVQWYNERSKNLQQHYEVHLEHQKQKLAEENEAGLLEALKQSLQNIESDHLSDFACLSSALGDGNDFIEKPSMLKELLMSPFSNNYSREINSPEHAGSDINTFGNSSLCQSSPDSSSQPCTKKKLAPFAELLKHMEAADSRVKKPKIVSAIRNKQTGTSLVNTKRYIKKYGTTADNKKSSSSLSVEGKPVGKRIVLHPIKKSGMNGVQGCKTLTLSLKPGTTAKLFNGSSGPNLSSGGFPPNLVVPSKSVTLPTTSSNTVIAAVPTQVCKRSATPPDDCSLVPQKKACVTSTSSQSGDHDYCNASTNSQTAVTGTESSNVESAKDQSKAYQKVLKWQDYLQQVRAGVRSAPNSPTCSPKVVRGSARQSNNFMIVSLQGNHAQPKIFINTTAGKAKQNSSVPLPEALRKKTTKQTFGLQEFDTYLNNLQTNLNPPKSTASNLSLSVKPSMNTAVPICSNTLSSKNAPASYSLAAMVQKQQTEMRNKELQECEQSAISPSSAPQNSCNQASIDNSRAEEKPRYPSCSSGQLLMIKVPVTSSSIACRTSKVLMEANASTSLTQSSPAIISPNDNMPTSKHMTKSQQTAVSTTKSSPTFKLMTSNKDGVEAKSLILSGVTGKLKEILTLMAEQQAKCNISNNDGFNTDEQQLSTLQKLISCLGSQKSAKKGFAHVVATADHSDDAHHSLISNSSNTKSASKDSAKNCQQINDASASVLVQQKEMQSLEKSLKLPGDADANIEGKTKDNAFCHIAESINLENITSQTIGNQSEDITHTTSLMLNHSPVDAASCAAQSDVKADEITVQPDVLLTTGNKAEKDVRESKKYANKFSMTRSMAAAEMLASDVIDDGTEEIMVYKKQTKLSEDVDRNNNEVKQDDDNDPAVITLGEAMECLENDEILGQNDSNVTSLCVADNLFCKLPSYFLTGKLMSEVKQEENLDGLKKRGLKNVLCDPLISAKRGETAEVEFNKLPHYLSSGKTRPNSPNCDGQAKPASNSASGNSDFAVKLHPVGDNQHLTVQGTPVDTSQTYYSRLPTYYTYGRPHPPVKTFNDEVADSRDDTVTTHTLETDKASKHRKRSKKKHKMKKKKHKHTKNDRFDENEDKVLYSKLPSYYLSGRILPSREKEKTRRISPVRLYSVHSPSPHSLSYSSRSSKSRSRSPIRRSRSRRRFSSRSFSRSSSRSPSSSECESRRSWQKERSRSRRERSYDRRSYDSFDEDHDEFVRHRERAARRARKQCHDAKEKDKQRAMEERRVVYVGGIDRHTTKQELRRRFLRFGNIETISLHFRDDGDNYGFITFQYTCDAFRAIEEGKDLGPGEPRYDLCFGGRRQFCQTAYKDLDSKVDPPESKSGEFDDFDALLQQARRNLRR